MPAQVRWFTSTYYTDGRQRAQLHGDSSQGRPRIDHVKILAGKHVRCPVTSLMKRELDGTHYLDDIRRRKTNG